MTDIATLGIVIKSNGINEASSGLDNLTNKGKAAETQTNALSSSFSGVTKYIQAAAAAMAAWKLSQYIQEATMLAARVETLGVVMKVVGNNAGYTGAQMDAFTAGLKKMGITTQESMNSLIKMAGANMDLAKSSKLARVAQDAAVVGGINSSEAFGRMIQGIRSGEVEILKTIGINVQFEQGYKKTAAALGKTSQELTNTEKTASRLNEVLGFGTNIAGAYEASMTTAGKMIASMSRYTEELKLKIGEAFSPSLTFLVGEMTIALKGADDTLGKSKSTVGEWGQNFRNALISTAAEVQRLAMLIDLAGGSITAFGSRTLKVMEVITRFMTIGQFGDWFKNKSEELARINADLAKRYADGEKELQRLANIGTGAAGGRTPDQEAAAIAASNAARQAQARIDAKAAAAGKEKKANEAHEKMMIDHSVSVIKDAWEKAATEIAAEDFSKDVTKKLGILTPQNTGFTKNPTFTIGADLQLLSLEQQADAAKKLEAIEAIRLKTLNDQTRAMMEQLAIERELSDSKNAISEMNISMMNDPYAQERAAMESRYAREKELIEQKLFLSEQGSDLEKSLMTELATMQMKLNKDLTDSKTSQSAEAWQAILQHASKAVPALAGFDKLMAASFKDYIVKNKDGVKDETKSNLSMYSSYAEGVGGAMAGIAAAQDTASRSGFETAKALNIGVAIMSTAAAIMRAFSDLGYPAGIPAAALAAATGAIQIATIASTTFGGSASAPPIPSGSFGGSGSASSTVGSMIGSSIRYGADAVSTDAMTEFVNNADNASLAVGSLADAFEKATGVFDSGSIGENLINRVVGLAQGQIASTTGDKSTDAIMLRGMNDILDNRFDLLDKAALGLGTTNTSGRVGYSGITSGTGKYGTVEALTKYFTDGNQAIMDAYAKGIQGIEEYAKAGENASDAVVRLFNALAEVNTQLDLFGVKLLDGVSGGNIASKLEDAFGGVDGLKTVFEDYFGAAFSQTEQDARTLAVAVKDVDQAFGFLGAAVPQTRAELRDFVDSLDLTTDAGMSAFASVLDVSKSFGIVRDAADELADTNRGLMVTLLDLQGKTAESLALSRSLETAGMDASTLAIQNQIYALQDQKTALDAATAATAAATAAQQAAIQSATSDLQAAITAEKATVQAAYDSAREAQQSYIDTLTTSTGKLQSLSDALKSSIETLQPMTWADAMQQLSDAVTAARNGSFAEAGSLSNALGVLANPDSGQYATATDFAIAQAAAANQMKALKSLTDDQLSVEQQLLNTARAQLDTLTATYSGEMARLDGIVNAVLGVNTSVLSVVQAIANLRGLINQSAGTPVTSAANNQGISIGAADSPELAAAKVLYQSAMGGVDTSLYNQYVGAVGGTDGIAGWTGNPADLREYYSFDVGTNYVPYDMTAQIHEGERIIPKADNYKLMQGNDELVAEIRQLRAELRVQNGEIAKTNLKTSKILDKWDGDGMPAVAA